MFKPGDEIWSKYYGFGVIKSVKKSEKPGEENLDVFKINFPDRTSRTYPNGWSATLYEQSFEKYSSQVRGTELQAKKGDNMGIAVPKPSGKKVKVAKEKVQKPAVKKAQEPKAVDPNLLSLEDAEKETGKSLYSAVRSKTLPAVKQGRGWYINRADLKTYLGTAAA